MRDSLGRRKPDHRTRTPAVMSAEQRDRLIVTLRDQRRWSWQRIADHLGCARSTVIVAYERAKRTTRPYEPGEVDDYRPPREEW
jgi:DNA-directed RNA polymerase specialized sigma24 family protein